MSGFPGQGGTRVPLGQILEMWGECEQNLPKSWQRIEKCLENTGFPAVLAGAKCVQVKGRVAFKSPPRPVHTARQSRAENILPPKNSSFAKMSGLRGKKSQNRKAVAGGLTE